MCGVGSKRRRLRSKGGRGDELRDDDKPVFRWRSGRQVVEELKDDDIIFRWRSGTKANSGAKPELAVMRGVGRRGKRLRSVSGRDEELKDDDTIAVPSSKKAKTVRGNSVGIAKGRRVR